ncbi:MAG: HK97 gp10 family phage protein [Elusimicrobia bacterium]|nr:HK97 gp10 family phage protein [Elusimicrobiota bacterium]
MITITIKGKDETLKLLERLPQRLILALVKGMRDSAILVQSLTKTNAPVFRGLLRVSILQGVSLEGNRIVGHVGSALAYASVVEFGRTTGWFPNVSELKVWARRKLGDERKAFVVGRAIKTRGFRKQPYLLPALESARPRVEIIFQSRLAEAIQAEGGEA